MAMIKGILIEHILAVYGSLSGCRNFFEGTVRFQFTKRQAQRFYKTLTRIPMQLSFPPTVGYDSGMDYNWWKTGEWRLE
jgi:hypothetical protein